MERLSQSPVAPDFVQNPYPFYDRARAAGPLFHWDDYNLVCATSFAAVDGLFRDRRLGRERPPELARPVPERLKPFYDFESRSMLELEPPNHTRLRGLVVRAFTSRRIAGMAPDIVALTHDLIDRFPSGRVNLLPAFAEKIPVIVIARMLGVPEVMADQLLAWSHAMVAMYQANRSRVIEDDAVAATCAFSDFMRSYIDARRRDPKDDLLSELIAAEQDGGRLSTDELVTTAILLLNAGHEATVHGFGNAIKTLLEEVDAPETWLSPDRVDACVEETLRYDPPLHMFTRYVYEDLTLFGHDFRRGDEIGLLLAAANRDPAVFPDPNRFDPSRPVRTITSFGAGLHFCIGAPLARLEMTLALPILFERCRNMQVTATPTYADRYHFHGLERLDVHYG
jgi:cytochrome P450